MQWLQQTLGLNEFGGMSSTQLKAPIPKETLLQFFSQCKAQFADGAFKSMLSAAVASRKDPQDVINDMQRLVWEGLSVQPEHGMAFLGKIKATYGDDAQLMVQFMDMVNKEEMALDEAELPPQEFHRRQALSERIQQEMMASAAELQGMDAEQQQAYMAQVYKRVLQEQASKAGATDPTQTGSALSAQEQMAFFASLQNGGGLSGSNGAQAARWGQGNDALARTAAHTNPCCSSHSCGMQRH